MAKEKVDTRSGTRKKEEKVEKWSEASWNEEKKKEKNKKIAWSFGIRQGNEEKTNGQNRREYRKSEEFQTTTKKKIKGNKNKKRERKKFNQIVKKFRVGRLVDIY